MKKSISLLLLALVIAFVAPAQEKDPVLLVVDGKPVTRSEFEAVYRKNNRDAAIDPEALKEYMDLFINFKLKVREAETAGLDTASTFINELKGYRRQLAQPYLTDNEVTEGLIREAYDRMKTDIRASHILIMVSPDASPKDTLAAWNQIMNIRNSIVKQGKNFEDVAREVSQDPSAKDNGGDLSYFTSMAMVYPFENVAYSTPVGDVSMPVRTSYGYHLVKVVDKRPARGQVLAGHIMVSTQMDKTKEDSLTSYRKIIEIYEKLQGGAEFEELASQFSDDRASAAKGGQLPWFGTGRMVPEFENAAYAQEKGNYSKPFQTRFGWHIVKKYDQKELQPFDELKGEIKTRIARDSRSQKSRESFIARLKKEYNYTATPKNLDVVYKSIDTAFFSGNWDYEKTLVNLDKNRQATLFTLGDSTLTRIDFAKHLYQTQTRRQQTDTRSLVDNLYNEWVEKTVIDYENNRLEKKHPEFRALMQEYRDGILLFDLTDKKVWSKAVKDTVGLQAFYEQVKMNHMWPERIEAVIYTAGSEDAAEDARKLIKKAAKKGYSPEDIRKMVNTDSELNLRFEEGRFSRTDKPVLAKIDWEKGVSDIVNDNGQFTIVDVKQVLAPMPKSLKEARGLFTGAYQEHLEKEWIKELRKKYKVEVNEEVLLQIK